jgi:hypothetical protein
LNVQTLRGKKNTMNFSKIAVMAGLFFSLSFNANAQGQQTLEKGDILINPFITLGWYDYGYGLDIVNILPPVGLNFEYAISPYFSWGAEAQYGVRQYKDFGFTTGSYEYKYEYKGLGLRGSFHYLDLLKNLLDDKLGSLNSDKIDFYIGATAGYLITNTTQKWNDGLVAQNHERKTFDSATSFGYFAGFRYYFSPNFGAFAETGRNSLGWANVGLTLKF